MKPRPQWNKDHTLCMVVNDATGVPYLGIVRGADLMGGWQASSSMYPAPMDLGVFASADEAIGAVVGEAFAVEERRAKSAEVARAARSVAAQCVTGTGRATVDPEGFGFQVNTPSQMNRRNRRARKLTEAV